jgi:hypothetical protein
MPLKRRPVRQDEDDLAWEITDNAFDDWVATLHNKAMYHAIADFILKHKPGKPVELHRPIMGGFNITWRLEYKDGTSTALRVPAKSISPRSSRYSTDLIDANLVINQFPDEKVRYEVATMRYVAAHTTIPVPKVYHYGPASENPTGLGPFMIVEYVDHERTLLHALADPNDDVEDHYRLDPNISEERLDFLYRQMANIVVQLSTLEFPNIGSLLEDKEGNISVAGRPLIMNMNKLGDHARVPPWILPTGTFSTADEWYSALADMHMAQLVFQHNDAVKDDEDAKEKYVARQLFRRLAVEGRLSQGMGNKFESDGTFRLWSEDLRPSNVLVDKDDRVVAVIDWEFAYAAPSQFTFDPPWWLLLSEPDWYDEGSYPEWMEAYEPRLQTFLRVLDEEERKCMESSELAEAVSGMSLEVAGKQSREKCHAAIPLAQRMRESWETKSWMVNFVARKTWSFDAIFWQRLDPFYFGPNEDEDYKMRLGLLSKAQLEAMEPFVQTKLEEAKERILVEWDESESKAHLAKVML